MTSVSFTNARLRPCDVISRRTISSPLPDGVSKTAWTVACDSPVRMRSADARPPISRPDGLHEHRFSGAGFAGQDVQAGLEFDLERIDDGEVFNAKEAKHL